MKDLLIAKPTIRPKIQNAKLGICFLLAIMLTSIASIIVVTRIYENRIQEKISDISLLKDNNFKQWAQEPGSSKNAYTNTFKLYNYTGDQDKVEEDKFMLSDVEIHTIYNFTYDHANFGQGNKGVVNMINKWHREPVEAKVGSINNFNLGLNKMFNEQTMAPVQSRFPVLFKRTMDTLQNQFLPDFYTQYLWQFFFQYKDLIVDTIFAPLKLDQALQSKLLNSSIPYNWVSIEGIRPWIKLCISNYYITESYFLVKSQFDLTVSQMNSLIGSKSQMHYLAAALNSTIKNKLHAKVNSLCDGVTCTDEQLVAAQWTSAYLSKTPLMAGINIDKFTGQVNKTHRNKPVQYSESCEFYNTTCLDLSQSHQLLTDDSNNLLNFTFVNFIAENQNSPSIIEKLLSLNQGEGQSIINYVVHYFVKQYTIDATNIEIFSWIWLAYQNFNRIWENYLDFFINNLLGRAFYSKWGSTKCADYFQGDLEKYQSVCNISGYKLGENVESYFPYIKAYFYRDRQAFLSSTNMTLEQSQMFFDDPNLFKKRIQEILSDFNVQYRCRNNQCTFQEIAYRQWGSNDILSNLPPKYFIFKSASILDWDSKNIYHGYNIEYWSIINRKLNYSEVEHIMTYDEYGVLGEFSLKNRVDEKQTKDPEQMIKYLNEILINSVFSGHYIQKPAKQYLFGYTDQYQLSLRQKPMLQGGKPWNKGNVSLTQYNNSALTDTIIFTQFDQMNTGIFDPSLIRMWKKRVGRNTTGYKYPVYILNKNLTYTWIDTCRPIQGTNMLGFHTSISSDHILNVFIESLKYNVKFAYDSDVSSNKLKFIPKQNTEYFVGNDTLDGLYAVINKYESFLIVETAAGQTIEAHIVIKWYIKPGRYLFNVDLETKAYLYEEIISFKRPSEVKYEDIIAIRHTKGVILPILITFACVSFAAMLVLGFFVWKWRRGLIKLQDDYDNQNTDRIDTSEIRVRQDSDVYA